MTHRTLSRVVQFLVAIPVVLALGSNSTRAKAEGLNSENFYPAHDQRTGVLWETPRTLPERAILFGYTSSYALRPVELGDGNSERIAVSDHLQVNHLGMAYGFTNWLDLGVDVPVALYSAPSSAGGYLPTQSIRTRNFFFLGDMHARAKTNFAFIDSQLFQMGFQCGAWFPTGTRSAMLSDDSTRASCEIPMALTLDQSSVEVFFTPGASVWEQADRVYADSVTGGNKTILRKKRSLLLQLGTRYWLIGGPDRMGIGTLALDGGIRGDFQDFKPSLNERGSPIEWSAGAAFFLWKNLSLHGAYGTGLGSGVGAPLSRLVAGVRYLHQPALKVKDDEELSDKMLSSSAFNDYELNELMKQAQAEPIPPRLGEDESLLRLKMAGTVTDIGRIRFEFNSATLTKQALEVVYRLHEELLRVNPKAVRIEGHTDSIGSYKYNLPLSKRRAESVKTELVRLGHAASIIATEGFAFKYPLASNATKEGRAMNRRIEVSLDGESFRQSAYTPEEQKLINEWIRPGGKQPSNRD